MFTRSWDLTTWLVIRFIVHVQCTCSWALTPLWPPHVHPPVVIEAFLLLPLLHFHVLYCAQTKEQKWRRPGNETTNLMCCHENTFIHCTCPLRSPPILTQMLCIRIHSPLTCLHTFTYLHTHTQHNSTVRERVEKLELLMNERSTEVPSDPLTPLSTGEPHSFTTTPSRKIKIKNCEYWLERRVWYEERCRV